MNENNTPILEKPTILVIDDTPENLALMQSLLRDRYRVKGANNGTRASKSPMQSHTPT